MSLLPAFIESTSVSPAPSSVPRVKSPLARRVSRSTTTSPKSPRVDPPSEDMPGLNASRPLRTLYETRAITHADANFLSTHHLSPRRLNPQKKAGRPQDSALTASPKRLLFPAFTHFRGGAAPSVPDDISPTPSVADEPGPVLSVPDDTRHSPAWSVFEDPDGTACPPSSPPYEQEASPANPPASPPTMLVLPSEQPGANAPSSAGLDPASAGFAPASAGSAFPDAPPTDGHTTHTPILTPSTHHPTRPPTTPPKQKYLNIGPDLPRNHPPRADSDSENRKPLETVHTLFAVGSTARASPVPSDVGSPDDSSRSPSPSPSPSPQKPRTAPKRPSLGSPRSPTFLKRDRLD